jgi:DNA-binding response OmpR family regulator
MMGTRVLVVGGNDGPSEGLLDRVRVAAEDVAVVPDGAAALRHVELLAPDLILIRRPLPGALDAFETCRGLRSHSDAILVIISESPAPHDEIVALAVGADLLLPADTPLDLAVARLRPLVRRAQGSVVLADHADRAAVLPHDVQVRPRVCPPPAATPFAAARPPALLVGGAADEDPLDLIEEGDLGIDVVAREVRVAGRPVHMTRIEFDLLLALARNPHRVLTRPQLLAAAWDAPVDGDHVLDTHLSRLRRKIAKAGGQRVAHAVRGVGYRLRS